MLQEDYLRELDKLCDGSNLFGATGNRRRVTKVVKEDINVGPVLGSGAFSDVKVGKYGCLRCDYVKGVFEKSQDGRNATISNVNLDAPHSSDSSDLSIPPLSADGWKMSPNPEDTSYAVKELRDDLTKSMHELGVINLVVEAEFLRTLSHPNIVMLHGVGESPGNSDFFIVLEMLRSTLNDEIILWSELKKNIKITSSTRRAKNEELENLLHQRIDTAFQVSAGLRYLHEHNVLFRDLKPENIGFDANRCVKIFDFGMAKELKEKESVGADKFNATCKTGTPRYMSPEVFYGEPYGLPADVYSFALVLWEIMALDKIYEDSVGQENHVINVYVQKRRPKVCKNWPKMVQRLIRDGWSHRPSHRPKMHSIHAVLSDLL